MKKDTKLALWIVANMVWWGVSIIAGFYGNFDVNPFLGNYSEIILNILILGAGVWGINYYYTNNDDDSEEESL